MENTTHSLITTAEMIMQGRDQILAEEENEYSVMFIGSLIGGLLCFVAVVILLGTVHYKIRGTNNQPLLKSTNPSISSLGFAQPYPGDAASRANMERNSFASCKSAKSPSQQTVHFARNYPMRSHKQQGGAAHVQPVGHKNQSILKDSKTQGSSLQEDQAGETQEEDKTLEHVLKSILHNSEENIDTRSPRDKAQSHSRKAQKRENESTDKSMKQNEDQNSPQTSKYHEQDEDVSATGAVRPVCNDHDDSLSESSKNYPEAEYEDIAPSTSKDY